MTETADSALSDTQGTATSNSKEVSAGPGSSPGRLVSLDALRGVDMFLILGERRLWRNLLTILSSRL